MISVLNASAEGGHAAMWRVNHGQSAGIGCGWIFSLIFALIKLVFWPVVFALWCIELVIRILAFPFRLFAKKR